MLLCPLLPHQTAACHIVSIMYYVSVLVVSPRLHACRLESAIAFSRRVRCYLVLCGLSADCLISSLLSCGCVVWSYLVWSCLVLSCIV